MLSKEEIEKAKECLQETIQNTYAEGKAIKLNNALKYIDKLESDKQKLIEKLEERIKAVDKCYNELLTDVGGIKIINVTGLTKKEKEEVINKRNCLLVQKHCYVEILSILKGKKKEAE